MQLCVIPRIPTDLLHVFSYVLTLKNDIDNDFGCGGIKNSSTSRSSVDFILKMPENH